MESTRWKGKTSAAIATSNPMSEIITRLQAYMSQSKAQAMLSCRDEAALLEATPELTDLLCRSCFGREITTTEKDKQWFQLGPEEAFYLHHSLKCFTITETEDEHHTMSTSELWGYFVSRRPGFPEMYKAYEHLRAKNWVVRSGTQYGADFVAYRHHPALVHSEYAVLVLSEGSENARLRVWSDLQCSLRVSGSVAKKLLVLSVNKNGSDVVGPLCLEQFSIEERVIVRWVPEQCREEEPKGNISPTEPKGSVSPTDQADVEGECL
ncbi:tRNA-splicing endonuclease subunit Sen2-2-like [Iris pallida]|uniref:tRNA-intron lyase n=1 Tax=Iris pallida TaxID=29817 RepID=A0AAX6HR97_IRIPA|nr:tRNA-splicing endonuclease subunit Sen2-2-like [Iris pallida]